MKELLTQRKENSKTFDLGNGRRTLDISMEAIHYKDNYADESEEWKDIDTTIIDGKVKKAPYVLTIDTTNKSIYVRFKRSGDEVTLRFKAAKAGSISVLPNLSNPKVRGKVCTWENLYTDLDLKVIALNQRIVFQRVLKSINTPANAEFEVVENGKSPHIKYTASDNNGDPIDFVVTKEAGIITETIDTAGRKFPIEIDPSIDEDVGASADDAWCSDPSNYIGVTAANSNIGDFSVYSDADAGMIFRTVAIANGSTIEDGCYLRLKCSVAQSGAVNGRVTAEKVDGDSIAVWSTEANFVGRVANPTDAKVTWNPGAWTLNTSYDSPEIKTIIQELVNRPGWASGNDISIFWEDQAGTGYRRWYAYDSTSGDKVVPRLHIEYTEGITVPRHGFVLFQDPGIV